MRKYLFLLGAAALPSAVSAQEIEAGQTITTSSIVRDELIVVTATGEEEFEWNNGRPITVISSEEIDDVQGADITRVLERAPSVTFSRNGGAGGFTGVRVRGAEAEQLLVLIDRVRVADVASPGGGYDFGNLLPGNIDRIELLRGSNSTIWGSQAIAGVLAVESADGDYTRMSAEAGERESLYVSGSAGIDTRAVGAGLYAGFARSDGFSAAASGSEADGFRQFSTGGNVELRLTDALSAIGSVRYAEGELDIDGFPAPAFALADTPETQETRQISGRVGLVFDSSDLRLTGTYQLADTERDNFADRQATIPSFTSNGTSERAELRGRYRVSDGATLHFGGDSEWRRYEAQADERSDDTRAAYAQLDLGFGALDLAAGVRVDDHSTFGSETSFGGDASFDLGSQIRVRGSYGEGFKTPTLFQLFSDFGNRSLQPERSRSFDAGVTWGYSTSGLFLAATAFRRDTEDQIDFVGCFESLNPICTDRPFGTYDNIGEARAQGGEVEVSLQPLDGLSLSGVYGYVETENRTVGAANEGNVLARRPEHAATLVTDYRLPFGLQFGADLRIVSSSFDDAGNFTALDGYEIVTVRASVPLYDGVDLFGRVENVFDTDYQTAAGYGSAGRGAFVGVRGGF